MPPWLPWIFIGGLAFMILSFIASKYQDKPHKNISFAQDFISGGIVIALLGSLVPDAFPAFPVEINDLKLPSMTKLVQMDDDLDIQVGPLRR
jgi:hypothetical protein